MRLLRKPNLVKLLCPLCRQGMEPEPAGGGFSCDACRVFVEAGDKREQGRARATRAGVLARTLRLAV